MSVALTKSRCINALRAYASYALSRFGLVRISHAPLFVSVEPAAVCQLRCPACPVGMRNEQSEIRRQRSALMSREVWQRVLAQIRDKAWVVQFYFQGEPLLNKDLPQMISDAREAGLYTIVSTNAQTMTPETAEALVHAGLDRIIVSMDGLTDESYNAYRVGGSVAKTKAALRYLREAKEKHHTPCTLHPTPTIELQCLRLRTNEHEWAQFRKEYKRLGADRLSFKTAQLYDYADGHPLMPSDPRYSRYIKGADGHYHRKKRSKRCWRVWSGVVVSASGDVLPCCYDKAHAYTYGNIMTAPLRDLFAGNQADAFRRAANRQTPYICQECWK